MRKYFYFTRRSKNRLHYSRYTTLLVAWCRNCPRSIDCIAICIRTLSTFRNLRPFSVWIEFAIDRFIVRSTYSKMEFIHACLARLHKARSLSFVPFSSSLSSTSILVHSIVCMYFTNSQSLFLRRRSNKKDI